MTTAFMPSDITRMLMHTTPVLAGDGAVRDLTWLDPGRLLSSANPPRIVQAQTRTFGGRYRWANFIIASTGLMMTPHMGVASSDVNLLADASGGWLVFLAQPTGATYRDLLHAAAADPSPPLVDRQVHEHLLTTPIAALSREALAALSITKTQMANLLGIERPHFYQWLKGSVATPSKAGRLRDLLKLLQRTGITPQDPLRAHLLTEPLEPGATPLLERLAGDLRSPVLLSALLRAAELNRTITREAEARIDRLRAKGHDTGIDEAALANLDTTLTVMDWSQRDG